MSDAGSAEPVLYLVFTAEAMLLVKRPAADWRVLQDEFFDYKTSLGPFNVEDVVAMLEGEWPTAHARANEIRAFVTSPSTLMSL